MNFYVAMMGEYREGPYERPDRPFTARPLVFVAARISAGSERFALSFGGGCVDPHGPLPELLQLSRTLTGVLAMNDGDNREEMFLLDHSQPRDIAMEGAFMPSDGYACVAYGRGGIAVEAVGRWSTDDTAEGTSWQIVARQVSWRSEILGPGIPTVIDGTTSGGIL